MLSIKPGSYFEELINLSGIMFMFGNKTNSLLLSRISLTMKVD